MSVPCVKVASSSHTSDASSVFMRDMAVLADDRLVLAARHERQIGDFDRRLAHAAVGHEQLQERSHRPIAHAQNGSSTAVSSHSCRPAR